MIKQTFFLVIGICLGWAAIGLGQGNGFETLVAETIFIEQNLSFASDKEYSSVPFRFFQGSATSNFIKNVAIKIESGDLKIKVQLRPQKAYKTDYIISLENIENASNNTPFPILQEKIYGDVGKVPIKKQIEIILANDSENTNPLSLTGDIKISLNIKQISYNPIHGKFWGTKIYCDECDEGVARLGLWRATDKKIKFKGTRLLTLLGAATSAGLALGSNAHWNNAREDYLNYRTLHTTKLAAQPDYDAAQNNYDKSKDYKYASIVVGGLTLIWTAIQQSMQRERKVTACIECENDESDFCKKYLKKHSDKNKNNKFSLMLLNNFSPNRQELPTELVGIGLYYKF